MKVPAVGSRAQVFHGTAKHTSGGLKQDDLFRKNGRIVSKKASAAAKKNRNLGCCLQPKGKGGFFGPRCHKDDKCPM